MTKSEAIELQIRLAKKVIVKNSPNLVIKKTCGVDVSYKGNTAYCSAVIIDNRNMKIIESVNFSFNVIAPYIPGLFMLREANPIFNTLGKLKENFDLLLIDGNGLLHPRRCGLACIIGIKINKPTIGVAKNLLCGFVNEQSKVVHKGKTVGYEIKFGKKKIYVSIGHRIRLSGTKKLVNELIIGKNWYPEPLRVADYYSKKFSKSSDIIS